MRSGRPAGRGAAGALEPGQGTPCATPGTPHGLPLGLRPCAACAARQASARRFFDRTGTVWDAAWDRAGRQYYVDRATGRTSWQIDVTAAGAPGYYKARARARVVELLGDQR